MNRRCAEHWQRRDLAESRESGVSLDANSAIQEQHLAVTRAHLPDESGIGPRLNELTRLRLGRHRTWCKRALCDSHIADERMLGSERHKCGGSVGVTELSDAARTKCRTHRTSSRCAQCGIKSRRECA